MSLKSAKKVDTNRVEMEVEVDAAAFEQAVSQAYRKNIGKMSVPGFRKGKAPRHLVEKMYGEGVFYEDAINDIYPEALDEAIAASEYEYVEDKMDLDVISVSKESGLLFKAVITVKPEVEVGDYKGLKAEKTVAPVTDDNVAEELSRLQERNSRLVAVEDRASRTGDTVTFDFDGSVDGVPFEGGKAENYTLELGSGQFIPGFEDQMVGKKPEEAFAVSVTFPDDYQAKELAGKAAVFQCVMHEIKTKELPELNDDFAKDLGEFDTLDELKADLRKKMEEHNQKVAEDEFEMKLIDQVIEGLKAEIPAAMFEHAIDNNVQDFGYRLQAQGLSLEMYLQYTGMDAKAFREEFRPQAEKSVKLRLALEKIAALEKLEASADDLEKEYAKLAEQYQTEVDKVKAFIPEKELVADIVVGKAMDLIKTSAVAG